MSNLIMTSLSGTETLVDRERVETLRERVRGDVLLHGDPDYEEARSVWNAMIDNRPGLIVRCTGATDVIAAVDFARAHKLLLAVKSGGHNIAGNAVCDGGVMIDLSEMRAIHVDREARIARVQGGATWGDLDHETQRFGLATPGGIISTTGVAGLTLGGGFGWLSREYGLAADNLLSVEMVTASGNLVTASKEENNDLFWGIRGGGGNFGIVISFEFKLHDIGPVLFGPTIYPLADASDVLRNYRKFVRNLPQACSVYVDFLTAPPFPFLPKSAHGTKVLSLIQLYRGDIKKGEELLAPLRAYGNPIADAVMPRPYTEAQSISDDLYTTGFRNYWKSHNFTELPNQVIDLLVESAENLPTPHSDILIHQLGGVINDVTADATAYPHRDTQFVVTAGARWQDSAKDQECIAWVRASHDTLAEHAAGGTYVNFLSEGKNRVRDAYGANYDRLVAVKNKYDPTNLFRMNQNIKPAGNRNQ